MYYVKESPANTFTIIEGPVNPTLLARQIPAIPATALEPNGIYAVEDPAPAPSGKKIDTITFAKNSSGTVIATATYVDINQQPPPPPPPTGTGDEDSQNANIAALQAAVTALQAQVASLGTGGGTGGVAAPYLIEGKDLTALHIEEFGGKGVHDLNDTTYAAANTNALKVELSAYLRRTGGFGAARLKFGPFHYAFAESFRIVDGPITVEGLGSSIGNIGTVIRTPPGVDMCKIDFAGSNGWETDPDGATKFGATGAKLRGLTFYSREVPQGWKDPSYYRKPQANTGPTQAGILVRTLADIEDCQVLGPPGWGVVHVGYSAAGNGGNTNYGSVRRTTVMWGGDAAFIQMGSDGNQNRFYDCHSFFNGGPGDIDASLLGNLKVGHGHDGNGWFKILNAPYPSACAHPGTDGNLWYWILRLDSEGHGNLIRAQTEAPGADHNLWEPVGIIPQPEERYPLWQPNMKWAIGGYIIKTNPNASGAVNIASYVEDGQQRAQFDPPGIIIPGANNTGWLPSSQVTLYKTGIQRDQV